MIKQPAIELKNITKKFGKVIANKNVNLTANRGEILSILGENGSGKTTLMNMISGIYFPDEGQIYIDGKEVVITSPKEAFKYKIGMIHQHFKLVDVFNATENIALGIENGKFDLNKSNIWSSPLGTGPEIIRGVRASSISTESTSSTIA